MTEEQILLILNEILEAYRDFTMNQHVRGHQFRQVHSLLVFEHICHIQDLHYQKIQGRRHWYENLWPQNITCLTISAASAIVYRSAAEYAPSQSFGYEGISSGKDCESTMCQCSTFCINRNTILRPIIVPYSKRMLYCH